MFVVIIQFHVYVAAYGPFDDEPQAKNWIKHAMENHIIGSAMAATVSKVYEIPHAQ